LEAHIRRKVRAVDGRLEAAYGPLEAAYGPPPPQKRSDPLDQLVATILSQNTNDRNSHRAFVAMREAFPTWEAARDAPLDALVRVLKPGGLAKTKAGRIQRILRSIPADGALSLDHLKRLPSDEVERRLLEFDGVGYKTARCVLVFALGRDSFPIDTHVLRVLKRLDVIPEGMSADRAHEHVPQFIPEGRAYAFHVNLIAHGRALCHPRNPACGRCPVRWLCGFVEGE
jgi:endonuclease III